MADSEKITEPNLENTAQDLKTEQLNTGEDITEASSAAAAAEADLDQKNSPAAPPEGETETEVNPGSSEIEEDPLTQCQKQLAERTADLQRLQAEYINYKRRVDRDRNIARAGGIEAVVCELIPVLDAISLAKMHEELSGGFKAVADELMRLANKFELASYGEIGEVFDPKIHEALFMIPGSSEQNEALVAELVQPGYKIKERIIRFAKVAVSEPATGPEPSADSTAESGTACE